MKIIQELKHIINHLREVKATKKSNLNKSEYEQMRAQSFKLWNKYVKKGRITPILNADSGYVGSRHDPTCRWRSNKSWRSTSVRDIPC